MSFSSDYRLAAKQRDELLFSGQLEQKGAALEASLKRLFGRSLKLRQVSAGGCNGCEADVNVLATLVFDLARFGIQVVASPRHADGLLITGPVTQNMALAVKKTYDAVPAPKVVIAVGACAISGGPYLGHPEQLGGADSCCQWTSSSQAVRHTPSPSSMGSCASSASWRRDRCVHRPSRHHRVLTLQVGPGVREAEDAE